MLFQGDEAQAPQPRKMWAFDDERPVMADSHFTIHATITVHSHSSSGPAVMGGRHLLAIDDDCGDSHFVHGDVPGLRNLLLELLNEGSDGALCAGRCVVIVGRVIIVV